MFIYCKSWCFAEGQENKQNFDTFGTFVFSCHESFQEYLLFSRRGTVIAFFKFSYCVYLSKAYLNCSIALNIITLQYSILCKPLVLISQVKPSTTYELDWNESSECWLQILPFLPSHLSTSLPPTLNDDFPDICNE